MEYVHLTGTEDVSRAASSMRQAADDMNCAANNFSSSVVQLESILNNFLFELKETLKVS